MVSVTEIWLCFVEKRELYSMKTIMKEALSYYLILR